MDVARPRRDPFSDDMIDELYQGTARRRGISNPERGIFTVIGDRFHAIHRAHASQNLRHAFLRLIRFIEPSRDLGWWREHETHTASRDEP